MGFQAEEIPGQQAAHRPQEHRHGRRQIRPKGRNHREDRTQKQPSHQEADQAVSLPVQPLNDFGKQEDERAEPDGKGDEPGNIHRADDVQDRVIQPGPHQQEGGTNARHDGAEPLYGPANQQDGKGKPLLPTGIDEQMSKGQPNRPGRRRQHEEQIPPAEPLPSRGVKNRRERPGHQTDEQAPGGHVVMAKKVSDDLTKQ